MRSLLGLLESVLLFEVQYGFVREDSGRPTAPTTGMDQEGFLSNCRRYPIDESPDTCKDFAEVLKSVEQAGFAKPVATLKARFVIKDNDKADD